MNGRGRKKRCWEHDYCSPAFYMISICTHPRRECLGRICLEAGAASSAEPDVELSTLGEMVRAAWLRTNTVYSNIEACEFVVMPDHFHGILRVKERLKRHVGHIIKAFKQVVEREALKQGLLRQLSGSASVAAPAAEHYTLWEDGYYDTILLYRGQLKKMANYISDNPRRWILKKKNPEIFTVVNNLSIRDNVYLAGIGNTFLLDKPVKRQVQISRSISPKELDERKTELLYAARHGAVLVSPCISPGEKDIAYAALDTGLPLIVLLEKGLSQYYKPPGKYFDACADGRLLMLSPFPPHNEKRRITREQCLVLNEWAKYIAES